MDVPTFVFGIVGVVVSLTIYRFRDRLSGMNYEVMPAFVQQMWTRDRTKAFWVLACIFLFALGVYSIAYSFSIG